MDQPINWEHWEHLCSISLEVLPKMAAAKRLHCTAATASVCSTFTGEETKTDKTLAESRITQGGGRGVESVVSFPPTTHSNCVTMEGNLLQLLFVSSPVFIFWVPDILWDVNI